MKIGKPEGSQPVAGVTTPRQAGETARAEGAKPAAGAAADPSAQVQLSDAVSVLLADTGGDFDAAKVARISQAIENGTFKVNAEAIADKLIANAKELLGKVGN
jgi:negative regulator of flagellin synthesis FlgM